MTLLFSFLSIQLPTKQGNVLTIVSAEPCPGYRIMLETKSLYLFVPLRAFNLNILRPRNLLLPRLLS